MITTEEVLQKIKSRGYWRINFRPVAYRDRLSTVAECRSLVERNALSLRGWEYPAKLLGAPNVLRPNSDKYAGLVNDWQNHVELWRMYKSGQFFHLLALREDWLRNDQWGSAREKAFEPCQVLSVVGTIYQATEIYQFLANLVRDGVYDDGVEVLVELHNLKGRALWLDDPLRVGFSYPRVTDADHLEWKQLHSMSEVLDKATVFARALLRTWFDAFDWQASDELISGDQEKLLTRSL